MANERADTTDVGTGSNARPDVGGSGAGAPDVDTGKDWAPWYHNTLPDGSEIVTPEDWEAWYQTSRLGCRTPDQRATDDRAAAAGRRSRYRRVATLATATAAVLAVFSAGILYADFRRPPTPAAAVAQPATSVAPAPAVSPSPSKVIVQAPADVPVVTEPVGAVRGAPPVQLSLPTLDIDQRLVGLRVRADQQLDVPQSYDDIGWWSTGPVPGDPGAALMVGHLDSKDGPAVFSGLPSLTKGAIVSVRRADGTRVKFAVNKVQSFPKDDFPDELVYRTEGKSSLHLLTCGGAYDPSGGYRDNVVVFADLIKPKKASTASKSMPKPTTKPRAKAATKPRSQG